MNTPTALKATINLDASWVYQAVVEKLKREKGVEVQASEVGESYQDEEFSGVVVTVDVAALQKPKG